MDIRLRRRVNVNTKTLFIGIGILLLTVMSLGFAYLESKLTINGNIAITKGTWDVHFENLVVDSGSVSTSAPIISDDKRTITFSVNLTDLEQYYSFTVDAVNNGAIDAMVGDITLGGIPDSLKDILEYSLTYADGIEIMANGYLKASTKESLKVKVNFKEGASISGKVQESFILSLEIPYVQATEDADDRTSLTVGPLKESGYIVKTNSTDYPFTFDSTAMQWISGNKAIKSSTSAIEVQVKNRGHYVLHYIISSEASYDKCTITTVLSSNTTNVATALSGDLGEKTYDLGTIDSSTVINVQYVKDSSQDKFNDSVVFWIEKV